MRTGIKSIIAIGGMTSLFVVVIIYSLFNSQNIIKGVIFDIKNPTNGMTLTTNYLELEGTAKNAVRVSINDLQIPVDEKGNFKETIILSPGINNLFIKGEDKFGKENHEEYQIYSKQNEYTPENENNNIAISSEKNKESNIENLQDNTEEAKDNSYKL